MVLAMLVFATVNLFVKDTVQRYTIIQVVFFRCFFMLPPVLVAHFSSHNRTFRSLHIKRHLICGGVGFVGVYCLYYALRVLPLAEVTTVCFTSIFFVTLFAYIFLKETVNFAQWFAVFAGFMGVVIIAQPGGSGSLEGFAYALAFSVIDAFIMINARILTRHDSSYLIVFYFGMISSFVACFFLPFAWTTPHHEDLIKLVSLGMAGGIGQILITKAYEKASASYVAPMIYTAILWNILFGFLLFGEKPGLRLIIGCIVIIASGLWILKESMAKTT